MQQVAYRTLGTRPKWDSSGPQAFRRTCSVSSPTTSRLVASSGRCTRPRGANCTRTCPPGGSCPAPPKQLSRTPGGGNPVRRRLGLPGRDQLHETGMGRIRGTSVAGAQGPMQFIPTNGPSTATATSTPRATRSSRRAGSSGPMDSDEGRPAALYRYNNRRPTSRRQPRSEADAATPARVPRLLPLEGLLPDSCWAASCCPRATSRGRSRSVAPGEASRTRPDDR